MARPGGRAGCGDKPSRRMHRGLMDSVADAPPKEREMIGRVVFAYGSAHIKTITETANGRIPRISAGRRHRVVFRLALAIAVLHGSRTMALPLPLIACTSASA